MDPLPRPEVVEEEVEEVELVTCLARSLHVDRSDPELGAVSRATSRFLALRHHSRPPLCWTDG
jgi:hypothetical protein